MRILLIEDDPVVAQSIELMLSTGPFEVETTSFGEDGVDIGKLDRHDLILLDLNLPDMSGYDVLRVLRLAKVQTPDPHPLRAGDDREQGEGAWFSGGRLPHEAVSQGRAGRPHSRHSASFGSRCGARSPVR